MTRGLTCLLLIPWLVGAVAAQSTGQTPSATGVVIDSKVLDGYVWRYQVLSNFILVITRERDHLMV